MAFQLPDLPYDYAALDANIDEQTMRIHHDKHHAVYVNNLNAAIEKHPELADWSLEKLLRDINQVPEDIRGAVRNHGGGHANHSMFWEIMSPNGGGEPSGALADAINSTFGSFADFKEKLSTAAMTQFGSGWGWLSVDGNGGLVVENSPNQDNPLMHGNTPILGVDVWEHAYYLKYQNVRPDYVSNWWNTINWDAVTQRYEMAKG
jgi:Fe-Mn family superoxide dismutase